MAGLKRKLEGEIEIRVAGGDAFHEVCQNRPHDIANIHPEFIQDCELHEGVFGKPGSKLFWHYSIDGKKQSVKHLVELVDEKNKTMRLRLLEGDLMEDYSSFVITYQVKPKGGSEEISIVKWTFEYEKKHQGVREPSAEMDVLLEMAKKTDDHHHRQDN